MIHHTKSSLCKPVGKTNNSQSPSLGWGWVCLRKWYMLNSKLPCVLLIGCVLCITDQVPVGLMPSIQSVFCTYYVVVVVFGNIKSNPYHAESCDCNEGDKLPARFRTRPRKAQDQRRPIVVYRIERFPTAGLATKKYEFSYRVTSSKYYPAAQYIDLITHWYWHKLNWNHLSMSFYCEYVWLPGDGNGECGNSMSDGNIWVWHGGQTATSNGHVLVPEAIVRSEQALPTGTCSKTF